MNTPPKRRTRGGTEAAARIVARLVARDGRIDWRELEFLDRAGAFGLLRTTRERFMDLVGRCLAEQAGTAPHGPLSGRAASDFAEVTERRLQLLVAALLVYVSEIDRDVQAPESDLVQTAFAVWDITPECLHREMRVPPERTRAALPGAAALA